MACLRRQGKMLFIMKEQENQYYRAVKDRRVFSALEAPFFQVAPEFSDLGRSARFEEELKNRYPNLIFRTGCVVDGAVLIQDLSVEVMERGQSLMYEAGGGFKSMQELAKRGEIPPFLSPEDLRKEWVKNTWTLSDLTKLFNKTSNVTLQVVDGLELSAALNRDLDNIEISFDIGNSWDGFKLNREWERKEVSSRRSKPTLYFFPGNGAETIGRYFTSFDPWWFNGYQGYHLSCERKMLGKGKFEVSVDYSNFDKYVAYQRADKSWPSCFIDPEDAAVVFIVDDVIASGQTLQTVVRGVRERCPKATIVAATWLFLEPTLRKNKNSPSGIEGVDYTYSVMALGGNYVSRPPIMSLSCFLRSGEKYDQAKTSFIEKYISDSQAFKRLIDLMRKEFIT